MKLEKQDDEELEMLLDEIPHATSLHHHHHHHHHGHVHDGHGHVGHVGHVHDGHGHEHSGQGHTLSSTHIIHGMFGDDNDDDDGDHPWHGYGCASPGSKVSLWSEGSSTSGSSPPPLDEPKLRMPAGKIRYPDGFRLSPEFGLLNPPVKKNLDGIDELGLSDKIRSMRIRDGDEKNLATWCRRATFSDHPNDPSGFQFSDCYPFGNAVINGNAGVNSPSEGYLNGFSSDRRSSLLGLQHQFHMGNLSGSCFSTPRSDSQFSCPDHYTNSADLPGDEVLSNLKHRSEAAAAAAAALGGKYYGRGANRVPNIANSVADTIFHTQHSGINYNGDLGVLNSLHMRLSEPRLGVRNLPHYSLPMLNGQVQALPNSWVPQSPSQMRNLRNVDCEDSFILQANGLNYVVDNRFGLSRDHKLGFHNKISKNSELRGVPSANSESGDSPRIYSPLVLPAKYNSLSEVEGLIYYIAKDQHGCRFLQRKFDEGTPQDVQTIFSEIIYHVIELMMDPFGNYLIQKLLEVCSEEQRMQILLVVNGQPGNLVRISLNTHGTRAVQKLIETIKTREQISLVISALEPGFLTLIKDLNGNHVVQRCLQFLSIEDNKFIFDAAAKYCVDISTHRHGCCVLQRCISQSTGEHREKLVSEISANGLLLAQDAFGNYVVQFILDMRNPSVVETISSQFEGNYVHLSMQKFSSNVVEKCLKVFGEEKRSRIIHELLSESRFDQLLQDPFANYVIQSALEASKGSLHAALVEAIHPHAAVLRSSPYSKRIYLQSVSKK